MNLGKGHVGVLCTIFDILLCLKFIKIKSYQKTNYSLYLKERDSFRHWKYVFISFKITLSQEAWQSLTLSGDRMETWQTSSSSVADAELGNILGDRLRIDLFHPPQSLPIPLCQVFQFLWPRFPWAGPRAPPLCSCGGRDTDCSTDTGLSTERWDDFFTCSPHEPVNTARASGDHPVPHHSARETSSRSWNLC